MVSVATIRAPVRATIMVKIRPIGPWPRISDHIVGLRIDLFDALEAGVHRLDEAGLTSKDTPSGIFSTPCSTIQSMTRTYCENPPPAGSYPAVTPTFL